MNNFTKITRLKTVTRKHGSLARSLAVTINVPRSLVGRIAIQYKQNYSNKTPAKDASRNKKITLVSLTCFSHTSPLKIKSYTSVKS